MIIEPRYRRDYSGEYVLLETRIANNETTQKREWIPNAIENHHISGRAAVIGSDVDQSIFDYRRLMKHRGGLLGKKRLQTYGSGDLWSSMKFDFYIAQGQSQINDMLAAGYDSHCTVYATANDCLRHPGHFYLIPYSPFLSSIAISLYLAAFDGHEEIFMLGYNLGTPTTASSWIDDVNLVLKAYKSTKFVLIGPPSNMPAVWRQNTNVSCIDYRKFITHCDI